jgi:hypothetical protein
MKILVLGFAGILSISNATKACAVDNTDRGL